MSWVNWVINLKNEQIKHKRWGFGAIVEQTDTYIKIEFSVGIKQFQYPEAFENFLKCSDTQLQEKIINELADKKQQEAEKKIKLQEERKKVAKIYEHTVKIVSGKKKTYPNVGSRRRITMRDIDSTHPSAIFYSIV